MTTQDRATLTVVALAWQEGAHLAACFRSLEPLVKLTGAFTLIILDNEADAITTDIANRVADRVVVSDFVNFSAQRNKGLDLSPTRWVFFIDADERCAPRLAHEIAQVIQRDDCAAYRVPRRNFFFGREVRHTGWRPDYQIRLLQRARCRYDEGREVHEVPIVDGPIGNLHSPLVHFNYENWRQFIKKQRAYAPLEARALYQAGHRARPRSLVGQPLRELKRRLLDYQGYRDGPLGIALSFAMALYMAETYRQLLRLQARPPSRQ